MFSTLKSDMGVWGTACGSGVRHEWLSLDLHLWRSVTWASHLTAERLVTIIRPVSAPEGKGSQYLWSTGFCQVLYECYLVKSLQPSYGRALIHFQVIAEDMEAQRLRNSAKITELVTDFQAYICLILSSTLFLLSLECLRGGTCTAVSMADIINHSDL